MKSIYQSEILLDLLRFFANLLKTLFLPLYFLINPNPIFSSSTLNFSLLPCFFLSIFSIILLLTLANPKLNPFQNYKKSFSLVNLLQLVFQLAPRSVALSHIGTSILSFPSRSKSISSRFTNFTHFLFGRSLGLRERNKFLNFGT